MEKTELNERSTWTCFICKKSFVEKESTKDTYLLRNPLGYLSYCCAKHVGVHEEAVKQRRAV